MNMSGAENYRGAIGLLTQVISLDSNNAQAYFERGMAYLSIDKKTNALSDFDNTLTLEPTYPGARDWRATTYKYLGDHLSAANDYLEDLRANPDGPYEGLGVSHQVWADCADSFIRAGDHLKAKELLEEYFAEYAQKVLAYACYETAPMRILVDLTVHDDEFDQACELAKKGYSSNHQRPADVSTYFNTLKASGNITEARRIRREAMKKNIPCGIC